MTQNERLKAKQRLIELFETSPSIVGSATWREYYEQTADHFLDNGVIVPPCKVGDVVYRLDIDCKMPLIHSCDDNCFSCKNMVASVLELPVRSCFDQVTVMHNYGKFYFSTREEAEQALKERDGK